MRRTQRADVLACEDGHDAGEIQRRLGVDPENVGGRVRAAHNTCKVHAGQLDVVDVCCRAGDKPGIFLAPDLSPPTNLAGP